MPISNARALERTLLQFPSVSTEVKLTSRQHVGISCKAKQVPHEPKTAQGKQIWRAKLGASPHEGSCEVKAQPRLSREDKGKALTPTFIFCSSQAKQKN